MRITPINFSRSFVGSKENKRRIEELQNEYQRMRWGTEGCNGGLDFDKERELNSRIEYDRLLDKKEQLRWAQEGCNGCLSPKQEARLCELERRFSDDTCDSEELPSRAEHIETRSEFNMPIYEVYGVPASTFYGDWAN